VATSVIRQLVAVVKCISKSSSFIPVPGVVRLLKPELSKEQKDDDIYVAPL
jgi:hypothetical protein